jgi:hypothetical protein
LPTASPSNVCACEPPVRRNGHNSVICVSRVHHVNVLPVLPPCVTTCFGPSRNSCSRPASHAARRAVGSHSMESAEARLDRRSREGQSRRPKKIRALGHQRPQGREGSPRPSSACARERCGPGQEAKGAIAGTHHVIEPRLARRRAGHAEYAPDRKTDCLTSGAIAQLRPYDPFGLRSLLGACAARSCEAPS